ncbi:MAG: phosphatidate cytidylyltransferase [Clostridia bacterium]|nr:phosphatidate cytidylyltransferase [Clostridia bacterium]
MTQRIITALGLICILLVLMYLGGAVLSIVAIACTFVAMYEEFRALKGAGHRIITWPTWAGTVAAALVMLFSGVKIIVPMLAFVSVITLILVVYRREPKLEDCLFSLVPLFTVALPGLCLVNIALTQPQPLQITLLALVFSVPVICDTAAFFVGRAVGGPKLCPAVSPNKTISGAIGGMVGALAAAIITGAVAHWLCPADIAAALPAWWEFALIGLAGGIFSQMGDLFASMVKRHCGIKDFSNIFPGHGGMLDRGDSIFFMAVLVYCIRLMTA